MKNEDRYQDLNDEQLKRVVGGSRSHGIKNSVTQANTASATIKSIDSKFVNQGVSINQTNTAANNF